MFVQLNIGLDSLIGSINPETAKREVAFVLGADFNLVHSEFIPAQNDNDEDTLFCDLSAIDEHTPSIAKVIHCIHILSDNLHQQCIAAKINGVGHLIGRNAKGWNGGEFDPTCWKNRKTFNAG